MDVVERDEVGIVGDSTQQNQTGKGVSGGTRITSQADRFHLKLSQYYVSEAR